MAENQFLKNKNVTDAQKRIAKIIREQQTNQNGVPNERSSSNPATIMTENPQMQSFKKKSSQQKSRNAAIQQSKSENTI